MLELWQCGCVLVGYIVHCMFGCAAVSLICWALVAVWLSLWYVGLWWPCGCQPDMLGFGGRVAISLICWALMADDLSLE